MTPTFLELRDFIKGHNVIIKTALSEIAQYLDQQKEEGLIELRRIVFEYHSIVNQSNIRKTLLRGSVNGWFYKTIKLL